MSVDRMSPEGLAQAVVSGDRRGLARAISAVENESAGVEPLLRQLYTNTGRAYIVGITGPPGAGKSTLVDALVTAVRSEGETVAVVAVDPSSPFSGGAVLGDRVRMTRHSADAGVFIRSMATRGNLGGLARTTGEVALLLDAAGFDVILIETVGVGQDEIEIVRTADTSVVLLVPGAGDDIQAIKAGIMEIADLFVVNKADREGADQVVHAIRSSLSLGQERSGATIPVLKTVAATGVGVAEVWACLQERRAGLRSADPARRRSREESRLRDLVVTKFRARFERMVSREDIAHRVQELMERRTDPYTAATHLLERTLSGRRGEP